MRKRLSEVAEYFKQRISKEDRYERDDWVVHVTVDSRFVQEGSLFFALKGSQHDGHRFLEEVARRGGTGAVVSERYRGNSYGMSLFRVPNVQDALQDFAKASLAEKNPLIIGVTGTVGKTTTKEFLYQILMHRFRVAKSPSNWNSQLGLPLTLLNWGGDEEILILEMGMSQKGEIARLVEIAPSHIGVVTQIGVAHGAYFDTLEEIAEAKCELFSSKKMTHAFLNQTMTRCLAFDAIGAPKTWFKPSPCLPSLKAPHLLENLGGAIAVAQYLGMTNQEMADGIKQAIPIAHRGQKVEKKGIFFIDDAYNASPLSYKAALNNFPKGRRKIGVLGAMKELGRFEEESHWGVAKCAFSILDHVLFLGKEWAVMVDFFRRKEKAADLFEKKEDLVKRLKEVVKQEDVVLVKGSHAFQLWTVIEEM